MSQNIPNWMDNFIMTAFGQTNLTNQKDMVNQFNDAQSLGEQNSFNDDFRGVGDSSGANGINEQTGENYDIKVKKERKVKDKNRKDFGLQVEFSSGKHKEKYICSSLDDFCNGKFSHLKDEPLQAIANEISKNNKFVFGFLEASTAGLSDSIQLETALSIANNITHNAKILDIDYQKLCSKLNGEDVGVFNKCLKSAGISVVKDELNNKISYYVSFIKNFEEYKLAKISKSNGEYIQKLKNRVGAISLSEDIKQKLYNEFKSDDILNKL